MNENNCTSGLGQRMGGVTGASLSKQDSSPTRQSEIQSESQTLSMSIEALHIHIIKLAERLAPILREQSQTGSSGQEKMSDASTPHGKFLRNQTNQVRIATEAIQQLTQRLEV